MDIGKLRGFDANRDGRLTKQELQQGLGEAAGNNHLDAEESRRLGLTPADASQINKGLKEAARGRASTTVFLLDGEQAVRLQSMGGAIFDKTESNASAEFRGITAELRLPQVSFDSSRFYAGQADTPVYKVGPLDRPSVYMGGVVDLGQGQSRIMDVGLCWDRVYSPEGLESFTDVVPAGQAHGCDGNDPARRFVLDRQAKVYTLDGKNLYLLRARASAADYSERSLLVDAEGKIVKDPQVLECLEGLTPAIRPVILDGHNKVVAEGEQARARLGSLKPNFAFRPYWRTTDKGENVWHNPALTGGRNTYFYPGEKLQMTVKESGAGKDNVELRIERDGGPSFATRFSQDGFGQGKPQAFKYVHSIDQFRSLKGQRLGNENRARIPTATTLEGMVWKPFLIDRQGRHVAMDNSNSVAVGAADTSASLSQRRRIFTRDAQGENIARTKTSKAPKKPQ